jgi:hypothetical protein
MNTIQKIDNFINTSKYDSETWNRLVKIRRKLLNEEICKRREYNYLKQLEII